jgi:hypothetical protein
MNEEPVRKMARKLPYAMGSAISSADGGSNSVNCSVADQPKALRNLVAGDSGEQ